MVDASNVAQLSRLRVSTASRPGFHGGILYPRLGTGTVPKLAGEDARATIGSASLFITASRDKMRLGMGDWNGRLESRPNPQAGKPAPQYTRRVSGSVFPCSRAVFRDAVRGFHLFEDYVLIRRCICGAIAFWHDSFRPL